MLFRSPNRRFPDLITQRLIKAALAGASTPYHPEELKYLADHCTEKENGAEKSRAPAPQIRRRVIA